MSSPLQSNPPLEVTAIATPDDVTRGEQVTLRADTSTEKVTYKWSVTEGDLHGEDQSVATWDTRDVSPGAQRATVTVTDQAGKHTASQDVAVRVRMPVTGGAISVQLRAPGPERTDSEALWAAIRNSTKALEFEEYRDFIDLVLCKPGDRSSGLQTLGRDELKKWDRYRSLPYPDVDAYRLLKTATEAFIRLRCGVLIDRAEAKAPFEGLDLSKEELDEVAEMWKRFIQPVPQSPQDRPLYTLPYFRKILEALRSVPVGQGGYLGFPCDEILSYKLNRPCMLELLWSYWHEEGMLVQTLNAISMRFQNIRRATGQDPLAQLEIDTLLPVSNLLWGYIQDEQHRLSVVRRAYEYDHHYGITLLGKAVPPLRGADSRSKFLEAFHSLLHLCTDFFRQVDDMTVAADGFPVLNGLKEVHLLLTEGQHNQYGDMPWTARQEMLMQQWLLARPEVRAFLPSRSAVAYPEPWMGPVDTMKKLQGWTDTSSLHFRNLAVFGERILLSIRFGAWNSLDDSDEASNWAVAWRSEIQGYIHAYRTVTGADLTAGPPDTTMPSVHLRRRLARQQGAAPQRATATGGAAGARMAGRRARRQRPQTGPS